MGFSEEECWSGLPCSPQEDLPTQGCFLCLLHWQESSSPRSHREVWCSQYSFINHLTCMKISNDNSSLTADICHLYLFTLVTQMVKNLLAMQETWVWSLCWKEPLEEGVATHLSTPAWENPYRLRSLVGYSPWDHKESDMTERLNTAQHI